MVDVKEVVDRDNRVNITVTSDKTQTVYTIQPTRDGYIFFEINPSVGSLPKSLQSKYSSPKKALKALTSYLSTLKKSRTVRVKENQKEYKRAAADKSDSKNDLREGSAD